MKSKNESKNVKWSLSKSIDEMENKSIVENKGKSERSFESAFCIGSVVTVHNRGSRDVNDRALKTRHKERLIVSISEVGQIRSEIPQFLIHQSFLFFLVIA